MINGKIIKVCGMREPENIREVEELDSIDLMGFIFYPQSPRYVRQVPTYLPVRTRRVGVFVNEEQDTVAACAHRFGLDYVQLHGNESADYCRALHDNGLKVIKAFSVSGTGDLAATAAYADCCALFLFDTKCEQHGGSGRPFDWSILDAYAGPLPFLLSGGIAPDSSSALKAFNHPFLIGYDLNSRFESSPGEKNPEHIRKFLEEIGKDERKGKERKGKEWNDKELPFALLTQEVKSR